MTVSQSRSGEYDGLATWKLNRLARNPIDEGTVKWSLQKGVTKVIKTAFRDYYPEENVLFIGIEMGMGTQESRDLGKNSKRGMDKKARMGWFPGRAPEGWLNVSKKDGTTFIEVDEERFDLLQKLGRMKITHNFSLRKLCSIADEMGYKTKRGKKLIPSVLHHLFRNPFTTGDFLYKGEVYKGNHKQMFTYEEFDTIQDLLGEKINTRLNSRSFAYTGLMRCGKCSHAVTAQLKKKRLPAFGS